MLRVGYGSDLGEGGNVKLQACFPLRVSIKTLRKAFAVICNEKLLVKAFFPVRIQMFFTLGNIILWNLAVGWEVRAVPVSPVDLHLLCCVSTSKRICRGNSFVSPFYNLCPLGGIPSAFEAWNCTFHCFDIEKILSSLKGERYK